MINKLEPIILQKQREVAALKNTKNFKQALCQPFLAVIAEIKRQSPSKGILAPIHDPVQLANHFTNSGANAISVLTDECFFRGKLNDLTCIANAMGPEGVPILRKDFMIDTLQIAQALLAGADAILCIVSVLGKKTKHMIQYAHELGLDVLVEIQDQHEIDIALAAGAEIIGVNNRNLKNFVVDTNKALQLVQHIPNHIIKVAESGIKDPNLAKQYYQAGFNAVLIGEALVISSHSKDFIKACQHG